MKWMKTFPTKEELEQKYLTDKMSIYALSVHYHCSMKKIKQWFDNYGIAVRSQGGHKPHKYNINIKLLTGLVHCGYTYSQISYLMNIERGTLQHECKKLGLSTRKHNHPKGYPTSYSTYSHRVRHFTEKVYQNHKNVINPGDLPRGKSGIEGVYHIDHIMSVRECYDKKIAVADCVAVNNLRMLPWKENVSRKPFLVQLENIHGI